MSVVSLTIPSMPLRGPFLTLTDLPIILSRPMVFGGGIAVTPLAPPFRCSAGFILVKSGPVLLILPPFAATVVTLVLRTTKTPAFSACCRFCTKRKLRWMCSTRPCLCSPPNSFTVSSFRISDPSRSVAAACRRRSILFEMLDGSNVLTEPFWSRTRNDSLSTLMTQATVEALGHG